MGRCGKNANLCLKHYKKFDKLGKGANFGAGRPEFDPDRPGIGHDTEQSADLPDPGLGGRSRQWKVYIMMMFQTVFIYKT